MINTCVSCGVEFEAIFSCRKYCNSSCKKKQEAINNKPNNNCRKCGVDITSMSRMARYCSIKCKNEYRNEHGKPRIKYCDLPEDQKNRYREKSKIDQRNRCLANPGKRRENFRKWKINNQDKVKASRIRYKNKLIKERGPLIDPVWKLAGFDSNAQYNMAMALPKRNAIQVWRYWLDHKAPDEWMIAYYKAKGIPWRNPRLSIAESYRMQYRLDTEFNIKERLRRHAHKAKKRDGIGDAMRVGLRNGGRSGVVERRLGYSIAELKRHIERQFTRWMTWDKYRDGKIHIDHIIPQSSFDTSNPDEWRKCWSLPNLRPMWAGDNIRKSNRLETLL